MAMLDELRLTDALSEYQKEKENSKKRNISPFEFVKSITTDSREFDDSDIEEFYKPWIVNKSLSNIPDALFIANELNKYLEVPLKNQFEYYFYSIEKKARKGSIWNKPENINQDIELVKEVYGYSREKAEVVLEILTKDQLEQMRNRYGGK